MLKPKRLEVYNASPSFVFSLVELKKIVKSLFPKHFKLRVKELDNFFRMDRMFLAKGKIEC